jgi:hypothetical protein
MHRIFRLCFILAVTLFGAAQQGELLKNVPYEAARFPVGGYSEEDLQNAFYALGEPVTALWLPSDEEIRALELGLRNELESKATSQTYDAYQEVLGFFNAYQRQYLGVVVNGKKQIVAMFDRCSTFEAGQLENAFIPALPLDGGSCFLELVYDPLNNVLERLYIHGEA